MPLNPTEGHIIAGAKIDSHRFVGRVKAAQLFQLAPDPRDSENKKKVDASKHLQDMLDIREEVQRLFEGQKKKNVESYAQYIADLSEGAEGITPPITLFTDSQLELEESVDGTCHIQIPWGEQLVAIDGETQLAARHEAANIRPETKQEFVAVYMCFGRDRLWARQAFHDLNTLGVRPNAALSIGMDARDPLTGVSREVERRVPFFKDRVNKVRRQLRATDTDVVTITGLRGACVTFAKGINGVQFGSRPVAFEAGSVKQLTEAAVSWFEAVADAIGPSIEDREKKLASTPAVLAAIGALGNPLASIIDSSERRARALQIAATLSNVNWERSKRWEGIAGKFTPKGAFSVGGAKETAYAVYSALSDPNDLGYTRIRSQLQAAA
jgi:DNA sulfur modification protein DndB